LCNSAKAVPRNRGMSAHCSGPCPPSFLLCFPMSGSSDPQRNDHSPAGSGIWRTLSTHEQGASRLEIRTALNDLDGRNALARQASREPEMGANVFSRPQTQRDVARIFSQVKGSPLDSIRRSQTLPNPLMTPKPAEIRALGAVEAVEPARFPRLAEVWAILMVGSDLALAPVLGRHQAPHAAPVPRRRSWAVWHLRHSGSV
jgi:hypothetical protein